MRVLTCFAVSDQLALHRLDLGLPCPVTFGPLVTESYQLVGHPAAARRT